jgi:hypothetical protein
VLRRRTIIVIGCALAVTLAAGVATSALPSSTSSAPGRTSSFGADAPGVIAAVGALDRLPAETTLPPGLADGVGSFVSASRGDAVTAVKSLRMLQAGLGMDRSAIFAFTADGEAACFVIWKRTAVCPSGKSNLPGVLWAYNGGYPATIAGIRRDVPSSVAGLFADNVAAVKLLRDGEEIALQVVNNSFFAEVPASVESEAREFELRVIYEDGAVKTSTFANPTK